MNELNLQIQQKVMYLKYTQYIIEEDTEIIKMATEAQGNRNSKKNTIKMKYVYWSTMKSVDQ